MFQLLKEGGCRPLWVTLEERRYYAGPSSLSSPTHLQVYPFLLCLSQVSFSLCCWPLRDIGACLLFTTRCIVTPFDLLLFEPDAVCLVAFNPLKG